MRCANEDVAGSAVEDVGKVVVIDVFKYLHG
jgi:hypothetical protein